MTTQVIVKSPRPNHLAVKVEALDPTDYDRVFSTEVLGDGDSTARFYVHSGSMLRITEVPKEDVLPSARELTFGEKAVGQNLNPSGDAAVANCKDEFAVVIDRMHRLRDNTNDPEVKRMASIAITEAQTAQMWAVKALTWRF
jgi:hypothetical protein